MNSAGVPLETRKVLLGHKNGDITSHYSAPEIEELLAAANRICDTDSRKSHSTGDAKKKNRLGAYAHKRLILLLYFGAPGRIRTHDPLVRSQVLYPTELRALSQPIL